MEAPSKRKKDPIYDHWIEQIVFDEDGTIDTRGRYKCKYGCDVSYVPGVDRMKKHTRQVHGLYFETEVSNHCIPPAYFSPDLTILIRLAFWPL